VNIIVQIIGLLAAAFLFYYSYRLLEKDHLGKSSTFALLGVVILFCSFPWFQGFVKSWISARIDARLAALGQQVNTYNFEYVNNSKDTNLMGDAEINTLISTFQSVLK
jgi:hypothetical protein